MSEEVREQLQATLGTAFTVDRELGGGGMSRVFVATDTTLDRQIVVKLLPSQAAPSVSIERFKREIKVAAKLQHPHIVPVLSAGESGGLPFYTMPYVAGESLRHRLAKGGELSVTEAVHILRDVAAALAYAHGQGVVHRDIKPENVLLSGGVAVVTDFGVSKAMDLSITDGGHQSTGLTSLGVALGTPAYMSPEQATADPHVDHRSDIYSFGCVAYEMLTGASPFAGRAPQQLLAAHVQDDAEPIERRRPSVPPGLATLVMKCLTKRPGDRPQSAAEVLLALDAIATPSGGINPTSARLTAAAPKLSRSKLVAGIGIVAVVGILAFIALTNKAPDVAPLQLGQMIEIATDAEMELNPAISPDGKLVAFAAGPPGQERIYVRQASGGRTLLTGDLDGFHDHPKWSPDGSTIMFVRGLTPTGGGWFHSVYTVPMIGGTPRVMFAPDTSLLAGPAWSPDGSMIAYGDAVGIRVRSVQGGTARTLVSGSDLDNAQIHSPAWSPDGRYLAFLQGNPTTPYNVSISRVVVVDVAGGAWTKVTDAAHVITSVTWTPDGTRLLYVTNRNGTPDVYQLVMRSGHPVGEPTQLTTGLNARTISLSKDGSRIAYDVVLSRSNIWKVAIPASGTAAIDDARAVTNGYERVEGIRISNDGAWLAYDSDRGGNPDIYKTRVDGGDPVRLTNTPESEFSPAWSPDDRELVFHAARSGNRDIEVISANGGDRRHVTNGPRQDYWPQWSPDGRSMAIAVLTRGSLWQSYVTTSVPAGWTEPRPLGEAGDVSGCLRWSPSGSELLSSIGNRLTIIPVESGTQRNIVDMRGEGESVRHCAWGRDGRIYFNTLSSSGRYSFWSVAPNGGTARLIMRDNPKRRVSRWDFDTDGRRLFFSIRADESDIWVREIQQSR